MIPSLILDSRERWFPCAVECILEMGASVNGEPLTDLEQLQGTGVIDFPADMTQPTYAKETLYYRVQEGGGLFWHQFWLWYLFNPKKYVGFGEHEGDWEMVQVGCVDPGGEIPILMTCSQHSSGGKREYWRVELYKNAQPVVYVALDSHANYLDPVRDVEDQADGKGQRLDPFIAPFGEWANWMGKWGNSQNSPGPLTPRMAWHSPHIWHGQARG